MLLVRGRLDHARLGTTHSGSGSVQGPLDTVDVFSYFEKTMLITRTAILQALIGGDAYGLEIIDRVKVATRGEVLLMQGAVYPVLRQLETEGMLSSYEGERTAERGGRPRRYYRITAQGRKVAQREAGALIGLLRPALGGVL
jgi:PadR family transcriptional regulator, regulatory protein PadR